MMQNKMMWCVVSMALVMSACEDRRKDASSAPPEPVKTETTSQAQAPAETEPGAAKPVEPPKVLDAQAARQAVEAWMKAQNKGDFEAYGAMYATRFTGVKRVGPRRFQYDREGWLEDRARMFKKKVEVTLEDIEVMPSTSSVVVRATQTWASGSYKDTGAKQFVLVPQGEDGDLKITREEMLSSQVVGQDARPIALGEGAVGFAMSGGRDDLFVLPMQASADWYDGEEVKSIERARSAVAPANRSMLPAGVVALEGKTLHVFGDDGVACEVVVKGFSVVGEAVPHFGQEQYWDGDPAMSDDGVRKSDEHVARAILEIAQGQGLYVAANVEPVGKACKNWAWGSVKTSAKAAVFAPVESESGRAEVLEFFASLPGYKKIQKDFALSEGKGEWIAQDEKPPEVHAVSFEGRTFVFVQASVGSGCGDFLGEFWALFEQGSDFVLLSDGESPGLPIALHSVTDIDGDETFEFVGPSVLVQSAGPVWRVTKQREVPFLDCPC